VKRDARKQALALKMLQEKNFSGMGRGSANKVARNSETKVECWPIKFGWIAY
jgi:hypothetical protein